MYYNRIGPTYITVPLLKWGILYEFLFLIIDVMERSVFFKNRFSFSPVQEFRVMEYWVTLGKCDEGREAQELCK